MNKPLHLIYIPGLGDSDPKGQARAIKTWPRRGVTAELFQMNWADQEPWSPKFTRLLQRIDAAVSEGKDIGLVGASAGATAVITAYAARKQAVVGCVLIAGKANRPHFIGPAYQKKNPAFVEAAHACQEALQILSPEDKRLILSRYAIADEMVYKPDSRIPGARNRMVPSVGHFVTIATQITLGAPSFIRFLKRLQREQSVSTAV